jgi:hypothetical protein
MDSLAWYEMRGKVKSLVATARPVTTARASDVVVGARIEHGIEHGIEAGIEREFVPIRESVEYLEATRTPPWEDDLSYDIGTCQGCGSYGRLGGTCTRLFDGIREECGEYM